MKTKKKDNRVPKSAKTRLSDLTPRKDTRGGKYVPRASDEVGRTPPIARQPVAASNTKRQLTL